MGPIRVIQGTAARRRQSAIEAAYDHFRVDRQGNLVSATLDQYHYLVGPFHDGLRETHPEVERVEDLDGRHPRLPARPGQAAPNGPDGVHLDEHYTRQLRSKLRESCASTWVENGGASATTSRANRAPDGVPQDEDA